MPCDLSQRDANDWLPSYWPPFSPGLLAAAGEPPPALRRGINITHWFRFPPRRDPDGVAQLSRRCGAGGAEARWASPSSGYRCSRPAGTPRCICASAVARVQRHGLAVVVALFPTDWHLETNPTDRRSCSSAWRSLAPLLRRFDPAATFPEVLNEPVFASDPGAWARLQHQAVLAIRAVLPQNTIVLTGRRLGQRDGSPVAASGARSQRDLQLPPLRAGGA